MRGERDFESYVAARGGAVARCLAMLGVGPADGEETATTAFVSLRQEWQDVQESADPDVVLWGTVLAVESRRRRRRGEEPLGDAAVAFVLREGAALEELQACEVLQVSVPRLRGLVTLAALAARDRPGEADVPAGPALLYPQVRSAAGRRRRRHWAVGVCVAATLALAIAVGAALSRPHTVERPGAALPAAPTVVEDNPADVVWWADGELHLARSVVRVGDVRRLVAAGDGAAYVDGDGRLVGVTAEGHRVLMGQLADGSPLVSSPRLGLVAWADTSVPEVTRLVVWDVEHGRQVGAMVTQPRVRPITFDGGWLRFGESLTDFAWDPTGGPAQLTGDGFSKHPSDRTALVDAVGGTRLEQWGLYLRVVRSGRRGETVFPGFGGTLSPDGRLVLTGPDRARAPRLYDARAGERLDSWGTAWSVEAAAFSGTDRITWLFRRDGERTFLTCGTGRTDACGNLIRLGAVKHVLIAGDSRR